MTLCPSQQLKTCQELPAAELMEGLMQEFPLLVTSIIDHAARWHGEQEVISCEVDGSTVTSSYTDVARNAKLAALSLTRLGVR